MRKWILFGAGLSVMCLASLASAQTPSSDLYSYASYANRVETLERELAQVHAQLASYGTGGGNYAKSYDDACCGESNWFVGAEVAVLQPFVGLPAGYEFNYEATPRIWLGFEGASGLGTRLTYWQFDNSNRNDTINLEVHSLDWDVTQRGQFCNWDIMVFGGVRYGKFGATAFPNFSNGNGDVEPEQENENDILGLSVPLFRFEGIGPTIGAEVRRPIGDRGFALVGNVRGSLLFDNNTGVFGGELALKDTAMSVWQTQLGVEWSRCIFSSSQLVVRALYEAQRWEGPTAVGLLTPSVSFAGPTLSVGIVR